LLSAIDHSARDVTLRVLVSEYVAVAVNVVKSPTFITLLGGVISNAERQGPGLQACVVEPEHALPPKEGAGLVHDRVCVPGPQVALQGLQADHPPSTGHS
jgi:hypothetical protein